MTLQVRRIVTGHDASGKAVVTTTIGCAGLGLRDRIDLFIDDDWAVFARSVLELLSNAAICDALATQARIRQFASQRATRKKLQPPRAV